MGGRNQILSIVEESLGSEVRSDGGRRLIMAVDGAGVHQYLSQFSRVVADLAFRREGAAGVRTLAKKFAIVNPSSGKWVEPVARMMGELNGWLFADEVDSLIRQCGGDVATELRGVMQQGFRFTPTSSPPPSPPPRSHIQLPPTPSPQGSGIKPTHSIPGNSPPIIASPSPSPPSGPGKTYYPKGKTP